MFISSAVHFFDFLLLWVTTRRKFIGVLSGFSDIGNYRKITDQPKCLIIRHNLANRLIASYRLNRKLLKFLRILLTAVYFKDLKWISKTMYCISCSMVCKIIFCSEFPDIPDKAGRKTRRRRRRRTQAIVKRYAFYANAIIVELEKIQKRFFWPTKPKIKTILNLPISKTGVLKM